MVEGYCENCGEDDDLYECEECHTLLCAHCYGNRAELVVCNDCLKATAKKRTVNPDHPQEWLR